MRARNGGSHIDLVDSLLIAADDGELETVRILVDAGIDVNATNQYSLDKCTCKALAHAAREGREDVAIFLLDRGAEINAASESGRIRR